jgi:hypothetical protein
MKIKQLSESKNSEYGNELEKLGQVTKFGAVTKKSSEFVVKEFERPFLLTVSLPKGNSENFEVPIGEIVKYDDAGADNVYFTYDGKRGYISSGDIWNLLRKKRIERIK